MGGEAGGHQFCGKEAVGWESLGYKHPWKQSPHLSSVPVPVGITDSLRGPWAPPLVLSPVWDKHMVQLEGAKGLRLGQGLQGAGME